MAIIINDDYRLWMRIKAMAAYRRRRIKGKLYPWKLKVPSPCIDFLYDHHTAKNRNQQKDNKRKDIPGVQAFNPAELGLDHAIEDIRADHGNKH